MKHTRFTAAIVSASALLLGAGVLTGCSTTPPTSAGEYSTVGRKLKSTQDASLEKAFEAAKGAMGDLQFTLKEDRKDALAGVVKAERADKTPVTIELTKITDKTTEVSIQVGTLGDEALSRTILDKLKARL
ncbi:MAG: DUF3568 family protein [Planctomycetota bacterium]|nr:DUF3568 family protein [Planctomycetota bacterium]